MPKTASLNSEYWSESRTRKGVWTCKACADDIWREAKNCPRHEQTTKHQYALKKSRQLAAGLKRDEQDILKLTHRNAGPLSRALLGLTATNSVAKSPKKIDNTLKSRSTWSEGDKDADLNMQDNLDADLVLDMDFDPQRPLGALDEITFDDSVSLNSEHSESSTASEKNVYLASSDDDEDTEMPEELDSEQTQLNNGPETREVEAEGDLNNVQIDLDYAISINQLPSDSYVRRPHKLVKEEGWYPWPNKACSIVDILRHLPRSTLSDKQHSMITWAMTCFGIQYVPSEYTIKATMANLQKRYGVDTIRYQGRLGHVYYVNDMATLIAQEMANPKVRPYLEFFPEDGMSRLENANQAEHWLRQMNHELLTPVVQQDGQDFYIFEPSILENGSVVVPFQWFKRKGSIFALSWSIHPLTLNERSSGWIVYEFEQSEVRIEDFSASFPIFCNTFLERSLGDPRRILGSVRKYGGQIESWSRTDPQRGNKWRQKAKGHQVYAFPIWLYCDDTSGNSSKKWNKHNSFLFTAAGLSHEYIHYEYNVHFLCTSNIAPPLEMFEGIHDQLLMAQKNGIWAWDCLKEEVVLLIPSIIALLGDNPMQSELACHVGLNGKLFCRICTTENSIQDNPDDQETPNGGYASDTSARSVASNSSQQGKKKSSKRKKVTMADFVEGARTFLTVGELRSKAKTITQLEKVYGAAKTINSKMRSKGLKTEYGVKDNYMEYFLEKIFKFTKNVQGTTTAKQNQIDNFVKENLPNTVLSPSFRIEGLDPNSDTPVEVLHVFLLGFLKYFWRDAMSRLKAEQKELLIVRISSLNTAGLGCGPISGKTLVQFAGSLTGRDFRIISQIAPHVLYDLIPLHCYKAWVALSALVPLVWQPIIHDSKVHIEKLRHAIDLFLSRTVSWSPRWCNKPKFHLLLHLIEHIIRFGPPLLFATETFESCNALVRALSVHSNRQAPSRDIGQGFANANRVRHFLSGGRFLALPESEEPEKKKKSKSGEKASPHTSKHIGRDDYIPDPSHFLAVGKEVDALIQNDATLQRLCGFPKYHNSDIVEGNGLRRDKAAARPWTGTQSSKSVPPDVARSSNLPKHRYVGYISCNLQSHDKCSLGDFVIWEDSVGAFSVGKVLEMLQIVGSVSELERTPDLILLQLFALDDNPPHSTTPQVSPGMPRLISTGKEAIIYYKSVMCLVNVQHNCALHECKTVNNRQVRQEREVVAELATSIQHEEPDDIILNCAQMRSYHYVQKFYTPPPPEDLERAIHEGAAREIAIQREAAAKKQKNANAATVGITNGGNAVAHSTANPQGSLQPQNVTHPIVGASTSSLAPHHQLLNTRGHFPHPQQHAQVLRTSFAPVRSRLNPNHANGQGSFTNQSNQAAQVPPFVRQVHFLP